MDPHEHVSLYTIPDLIGCGCRFLKRKLSSTFLVHRLLILELLFIQERTPDLNNDLQSKQGTSPDDFLYSIAFYPYYIIIYLFFVDMKSHKRDRSFLLLSNYCLTFYQIQQYLIFAVENNARKAAETFSIKINNIGSNFHTGQQYLVKVVNVQGGPKVGIQLLNYFLNVLKLLAVHFMLLVKYLT